MTQPGVTTFYLVYMSLVFVAPSLFLFSSFYLIVLYESGQVVFFLRISLLSMVYYSVLFSVLPCLLWLLMVSLVRSLMASIAPSMFTISVFFFSAARMSLVERKLQLGINRVSRWAVEPGFRFSPSKTVAMHFCRLYGVHPDPDISISLIGASHVLR